MSQSARNTKNLRVLITQVGSFLGASLAESLLSQNCQVYGVGASPLLKNLLAKHDFTLLELDLTQPLPSYLPPFDLIFDLEQLAAASPQTQFPIHISQVTRNLLNITGQGASQLLIFSHLTTDENLYDYLTPNHAKEIKLFLIGDIYGPGMSRNINAENTLANLIFQGLEDDKIVLQKEGLDLIYPAYIKDVVFAVNRLLFGDNAKNINFIVSEPPLTALSAAYDIQKAASLVLDKELNLFFAGQEAQELHHSEPAIKIHNIGFTPKVKLKEGLKNTLEYFASQKTNEERPLTRSVAFPINESRQIPPQEPISHYQPKIMIKKPLAAIPKLPRFPKKSNFKNIFLAILALLIIVLAKTGLDVYLGISSLKSAQKALKAGNFQKARDKTKNAANSFNQAAQEIKLIISPARAIIPQAQTPLNDLYAAANAAQSTLYFVEGSEILLKNLQNITSNNSDEHAPNWETPSADFKKAHAQSALAQETLNKNPLPFLNSKMESAQSALKNLNHLSLSALELTYIAEYLTGRDSPKTYLVLLENNSELRPGGGFIGNFGLIEFQEGRLKNITVEDIYTIDGQLQEKIEPPKELKEKLKLDKFYLRDSNWSPDSEVNSALARDFFKKETGKNVDGVITIDLTFIQNLLAQIGPINLGDYNEEITADNLFERGQFHSEIGFFPGSTQKRDFFGALTRTLIAKILSDIKSPQEAKQENQPSWLGLLKAVKIGLAEKHLTLAFDDPTLSSFARTRSWNNSLPPVNFNPVDDSQETRDFLALSEANLGANKVNRFLERKIYYEMTIGRDADLVAALKITYTNNSQAETWPAGKYLNFLRVYVPFAAGLREINNGGNTDLAQVEVINQGNLTTFAVYVEVPIKSTREITFTYHIPKNIKLEKAPVYSLYVQKQPGTGKDPFDFKFNLPNYLEAKSVNNQQKAWGQNIAVATDLATDRQFEIELAKK